MAKPKRLNARKRKLKALQAQKDAASAGEARNHGNYLFPPCVQTFVQATVRIGAAGGGGVGGSSLKASYDDVCESCEDMTYFANKAEGTRSSDDLRELLFASKWDGAENKIFFMSLLPQLLAGTLFFDPPGGGSGEADCISLFAAKAAAADALRALLESTEFGDEILAVLLANIARVFNPFLVGAGGAGGEGEPLSALDRFTACYQQHMNSLSAAMSGDHANHTKNTNFVSGLLYSVTHSWERIKEAKAAFDSAAVAVGGGSTAGAMESLDSNSDAEEAEAAAEGNEGNYNNTNNNNNNNVEGNSVDSAQRKQNRKVVKYYFTLLRYFASLVKLITTTCLKNESVAAVFSSPEFFLLLLVKEIFINCFRPNWDLLSVPGAGGGSGGGIPVLVCEECSILRDVATQLGDLFLILSHENPLTSRVLLQLFSNSNNSDNSNNNSSIGPAAEQELLAFFRVVLDPAATASVSQAAPAQVTAVLRVCVILQHVLLNALSFRVKTERINLGEAAPRGAKGSRGTKGGSGGRSAAFVQSFSESLLGPCITLVSFIFANVNSGGGGQQTEGELALLFNTVQLFHAVTEYICEVFYNPEMDDEENFMNFNAFNRFILGAGDSSPSNSPSVLALFEKVFVAFVYQRDDDVMKSDNSNSNSTGGDGKGEGAASSKSSAIAPIENAVLSTKRILSLILPLSLLAPVPAGAGEAGEALRLRRLWHELMQNIRARYQALLPAAAAASQAAGAPAGDADDPAQLEKLLSILWNLCKKLTRTPEALRAVAASGALFAVPAAEVELLKRVFYLGSGGADGDAPAAVAALVSEEAQRSVLHILLHWLQISVALSDGADGSGSGGTSQPSAAALAGVAELTDVLLTVVLRFRPPAAAVLTAAVGAAGGGGGEGCRNMGVEDGLLPLSGYLEQALVAVRQTDSNNSISLTALHEAVLAADRIATVCAAAASLLIDLFSDERYDAAVYGPRGVSRWLFLFGNQLKRYQLLRLRKKEVTQLMARSSSSLTADRDEEEEAALLESQASEWAEVTENVDAFLEYKRQNGC